MPALYSKTINQLLSFQFHKVVEVTVILGLGVSPMFINVIF